MLGSEGLKVVVYDTTLRDGAQARGIAWSVEDKIKIAERLDDLGVDYIEGGWPNPTNPKDVDFFKRVGQLNLRHARIAAFGSTKRAELPAHEDPLLRSLIEAGTPTVTIFGKSWDLHVHRVLRVSLEQNLEMIAEAV